MTPSTDASSLQPGSHVRYEVVALATLMSLLLYLDRLYSAPGGAILSTVLCTAILGEPIKAAELWEGDSDRIDHHVWAWPMKFTLGYFALVRSIMA